MLEDLPHPLQQVHGALSSVGGEYFVIQAASTACWLPALVYARGYGQIPTQMWHSGPMGTLEIHCVLPAQVCHTTNVSPCSSHTVPRILVFLSCQMGI